MKRSPCPECAATRIVNHYSENGAIYSIRVTHQPDCAAYAARQATTKPPADQ